VQNFFKIESKIVVVGVFTDSLTECETDASDFITCSICYAIAIGQIIII